MQPISANVVQYNSDEQYTIVQIPYGTYLIDNVEVVISRTDDVCVKDYKNIRPITQSAVPAEYVDEIENTTMSIDEYERILESLNSKGRHLSNGVYTFDELDDEYAQRRFKRKWKLKTKNVVVVGDPIIVTERVIKLETGNPYIESLFTTSGNADACLYTYKRQAARNDIVRDKFKSMGVKYEASERKYKEKAHTGTVYTNSHHSGIRFVQAFGEYIFDNSYDQLQHNPKGTLVHMQTLYEQDVKDINHKIDLAYKKNIIRPAIRGGVELGALVNKLRTIHSQVSSLDVKVKSESARRTLLNSLSKWCDEIELQIINEIGVTPVDQES